MRLRPEGPTVGALLLLLLFDVIGLAAFAAVFIYSRHWLMCAGVPVPLIILAANVLIRWRIGMLVLNLLLRPRDPSARLIALPDDEARRLSRFLSGDRAGDHRAGRVWPLRADGRGQRRAARHRADRAWCWSAACTR